MIRRFLSWFRAPALLEAERRGREADRIRWELDRAGLRREIEDGRRRGERDGAAWAAWCDEERLRLIEKLNAANKATLKAEQLVRHLEAEIARLSAARRRPGKDG